MAKKVQAFPQLSPDKSSGGGGVLPPVPPTKQGGYIPTDITPIETELPGPAPELSDADALDRAEDEEEQAKVVESGVEPWRQAALFLIDDCDIPAESVPRVEGRFLAALRSNATWQGLLMAKKPLLAEALQIELELPLALFRLQSTDPPASSELGRELHKLNLPVDEIVALLPTKEATIRQSIKLREAEMIDSLKQKTDLLKFSNAVDADRIKREREAAGHPAVAARASEREAMKRRVLREAGLRG